jgi:hypothetical protein
MRDTINSDSKSEYSEIEKIENKIDIENEILIKLEEEKDMKNFHKGKIFTIALSFIVMLTITFLKGSEHTESIISVEM